jgi:hypothetical protein
MTPPDIESRIRQNAGPAALAAALLIYFGFFYLGTPLGKDILALSWLVLLYTLRVGGILMAVVALWSWFGHRTALAVDCVASLGIGVALVLTGIGILAGAGNGLQVVLNCLFGAMFISAGVRNGREYMLLSGAGREGPADARSDRTSPALETPPPSEPRRTDPGAAEVSLASRLRTRMADQEAGGTPSLGAGEVAPPVSAPEPETAEPLCDSPVADQQPGAGDDATRTGPDDESAVGSQDTSSVRPKGEPDDPPPDGFLASFGDDGPPRHP